LKATLILGEFVQQHREKTLETVVVSSLPPKKMMQSSGVIKFDPFGGDAKSL